MTYISSISQLNDHVESGAQGQIFVGGDLVYVTTDKESLLNVTSGADYIIQPTRSASKGKLFEASRHHLYLGVVRTAIDQLVAYSGDVVFLADQYLAYGLSLRGNTIIIGGGEGDRGVHNLEVYVFTNQILVKTLEKHLQWTGMALDVALKDILAEYPDHSLHWCAPLGAPPLCDLTDNPQFLEVADLPLRNIVRKRLYLKDQKTDESFGVVPSIAIVIFGALVFGGAISIRWANINDARKDFTNEVSGYQEVYSNSSHSLDLLRHRDFLLRSPIEHEERLRNLDRLLSQVSLIPSVQIKEITIFSPDDPEVKRLQQNSKGVVALPDDFQIEIIVPALPETSARDQAEPILEQLNHATGISVRLTDHSPFNKKVGDVDISCWTYKMGGTLK